MRTRKYDATAMKTPKRDAEPHVDDREHDQRAEEEERAAEDVDEERDEELGDRVHVAVDSLDHLAGRMCAVVPDVERERVAGHLLAQAVRRGPRLVARDPRAHDGRALRSRRDHEVGDGDLDQFRRGRARGGAVHEIAR